MVPKKYAVDGIFLLLLFYKRKLVAGEFKEFTQEDIVNLNSVLDVLIFLLNDEIRPPDFQDGSKDVYLSGSLLASILFEANKLDAENVSHLATKMSTYVDHLGQKLLEILKEDWVPGLSDMIEAFRREVLSKYYSKSNTKEDTNLNYSIN